jgi:protein phosphatase
MVRKKKIYASLDSREYDALRQYAQIQGLAMSAVIRKAVETLLKKVSGKQSQQFIFQGKTDVGRVREQNEDNYLLEMWEDGSALLAVVADGMGGYQSGEVASKMAIDIFRELLQQPLPAEALDSYDLLKQCFIKADTEIKKHSQSDRRLQNMGTTIIAAIVTPDYCLHLYAGDCRLYHFRNGVPIYITSDHSIVQELLEIGQITQEEVATHPMRSAVTSCLGGKKSSPPRIDPAWGKPKVPVVRQLLPGDLLLLCSDGLHSMVKDQELQELVQQFPLSPVELTDACVERAIAHGGRDNITVIAIQKPK